VTFKEKIMFSTILSSVILIGFIVYTSVQVSSYFGARLDKRIDEMRARIKKVEDKEN
jgi:hypothetical protein